MERCTHAWIAHQAVCQLQRLSGRFGSRERNRHVQRFLEFIQAHQSEFQSGVRFPEEVLRDYLVGGQSWGLCIDEKNGLSDKRMPPVQNLCQLRLHRNDWRARLSVQSREEGLPARCETLSLMIRDMFIIRNHLPNGDVLMFNDRQIALYFVMLGCYLADAHVPHRCDQRTLDNTFHQIERFWEDEICRNYKILSDPHSPFEQFALDANLQLRYADDMRHSPSLLRCEQLLEEKAWGGLEVRTCRWNDLLGNQNENIYDYISSICRISFFIGQKMFPADKPDHFYESRDLETDEEFRQTVEEFTPLILADAVNSLALVWLATWERWELLERAITKSERLQRNTRV